jgi:acetoacetate decarboxylase
MTRDEILAAASMPAFSPSYPHGPYRFIHREYLVVSYESDPDVIRQAVPEPLAPAGNIVNFEFMKMPDSSGFGDYTESGTVIPCTFKGEACNFTVQMYLDDEPPIAGGREIWGFPKKNAKPSVELIHDTLTGTLSYAGQLVALGTMAYKYQSHADDHGDTAAALGRLGVNLKIIPDVDGKPKVAQLVGYNMCDITVLGSWSGPARLHLVPHVNAPVADFPVRRIIGGRHMIADMTLPFGRVLVDYLA